MDLKFDIVLTCFDSWTMTTFVWMTWKYLWHVGLPETNTIGGDLDAATPNGGGKSSEGSLAVSPLIEEIWNLDIFFLFLFYFLRDFSMAECLECLPSGYRLSSSALMCLAEVPKLPAKIHEFQDWFEHVRNRFDFDSTLYSGSTLWGNVGKLHCILCHLTEIARMIPWPWLLCPPRPRTLVLLWAMIIVIQVVCSVLIQVCTDAYAL